MPAKLEYKAMQQVVKNVFGGDLLSFDTQLKRWTVMAFISGRLVFADAMRLVCRNVLCFPSNKLMVFLRGSGNEKGIV